MMAVLAGCGGMNAPGATRAIRVPERTTLSAPAAAQITPGGAGARSLSLHPTDWVIDHGPRTRRWVALTFDADMTREMLAALRSGRQRSWYDASIVRELRATGTPATIFLTGLWAQTYPSLVRSLTHDRLFELENHSFDHSGWLAPCYGLRTVSGTLSKRAEITRPARVIRSLTGRWPRYFRFPGGCHSRQDVRLIASAGEQAIGWDVLSGDPFQPDPAVITTNVLRGVKPGSIVVMHLIGAPNAPATGRALPRIITALRRRGYRFVTLRRLLAGR